MPVTQKDIAVKLGVSPSLVSRALTGTADAIGVHPDTITLIQKTARALGYVPSATARKLRGQGKPVIGVMVADMGDPFFSQAVTEVIRQGHAKGFALAVAGFDRRVIDEGDIQVLLEQDLNGLLIMGGDEMPWRTRLPRRDLVMVRMGASRTEPGVHRVGVDEAQGFQRLFRHLVGQGHRHIGWVASGQPVHRERLKNAQQIARQAGLRWIKPHEVAGSEDVLCAGLEAGRILLSRTTRKLPSALICSSDAIALGVISVLNARGLRVPRDISVTGFDDVMLARLASPPLTTLHQPIAEMTRIAFELLSKPPSKNITRSLPLKLMVRASTGRAP